MSVRSEVSWQERCDVPGGCCEDGERRGSRRASPKAEEGA